VALCVLEPLSLGNNGYIAVIILLGLLFFLEKTFFKLFESQIVLFHKLKTLQKMVPFILI